MFSSKNKILITGANGFIGTNLCEYLIKKKLNLITVSRDKQKFKKVYKHIVISPTNSKKDWQQYLKFCNTIVHLSGVAHRSDKLDIKTIKEIN